MGQLSRQRGAGFTVWMPPGYVTRVGGFSFDFPMRWRLRHCSLFVLPKDYCRLVWS